jgi:hypothetical protein
MLQGAGCPIYCVFNAISLVISGLCKSHGINQLGPTPQFTKL